MANSYSPPGTINFFNSNFSGNIIYSNIQNGFTVGGESTSSTSFVAFGNYVPNSISIPIPGTYLIYAQTTSRQSTGVTPSKVNYQMRFTKSGQSTIDISDGGMAITSTSTSAQFYGGWIRPVTFPVSGTWTLTPMWHTDGNLYLMSNNANYFWTVSAFGPSPLDSINQQLTQFVDNNYTLMTNVDANAWWGSLTNATVAGYQTSITNNSNAIISHTSSISSLSQSVTDLTANVTSLQNSVNGLTGLSTISGGIRIKP